MAAAVSPPDDPALTLLTPADYRRTRWRNGRGWTTELAARPASGEFDWRVSIAEVDADCEFSLFPGIDRSILVLQGDGMELQVGDSSPVFLRAGGVPAAFSGDVATRARLAGGPTRDFNVMTRRGVCEHTLSARALDEAFVLERPAGTAWFIYLASGRAVADNLEVAAGQCVLSGSAPVAGVPLTLRGVGVVVLVRLRSGPAPVHAGALPQNPIHLPSGRRGVE